ncbi:uncharacterized protein FFB14_11773 [Fusarium fujikuroi]|nr:uncharacterized protein FFB14_11773 [Fusarium fujikuroi]
MHDKARKWTLSSLLVINPVVSTKETKAQSHGQLVTVDPSHICAKAIAVIPFVSYQISSRLAHLISSLLWGKERSSRIPSVVDYEQRHEHFYEDLRTMNQNLHVESRSGLWGRAKEKASRAISPPIVPSLARQSNIQGTKINTTQRRPQGEIERAVEI